MEYLIRVSTSESLARTGVRQPQQAGGDGHKLRAVVDEVLHDHGDDPLGQESAGGWLDLVGGDHDEPEGVHLLPVDVPHNADHAGLAVDPELRGRFEQVSLLPLHLHLEVEIDELRNRSFSLSSSSVAFSQIILELTWAISGRDRFLISSWTEHFSFLRTLWKNITKIQH